MNNYRQQNTNNMYTQQINNNKLINEYNNNSQRTNAVYNNNSMLKNNPRFSSFVQENSFQDRINIAKMEKLKKAQNLRELGMNEQELISYVINPIKIEKLDKKEQEELVNKYYDNVKTYDSLGKYSIDKKDAKTNALIPKDIADLWNNRKNNPYKNILQFLNIKDYTDKSYKKNSDLIIHKTTQLEKIADTQILKKEVKKLEKLLFDHDKELKTIYSDNRKKKFLEQFEYENKYKNKIKYDPKDCSQLKDVYKHEQKKISKQNKRIDDMIELLMASEDLSHEELEEIKKIQEMDDKQSSKYEQAKEYLDREEKFNQRNLEKELQKEIEKEIGAKEFNKLMNQFEKNSSSESDSDNNIKQSTKIDKEKQSENSTNINTNINTNIKNKYSGREKEIHQDAPDLNTQNKIKKITIIKKTTKTDETEQINETREKNEIEKKQMEAKLASLNLNKYKNR